MKDILDCTGGEVIDDKDLMILFQKVFREVRADESRAACNKNFHKLRRQETGAQFVSRTYVSMPGYR